MAMAAATHPEEAAKVQAELDAVVGHDRCTRADHCTFDSKLTEGVYFVVPEFADAKSLPRVTAFFWEVFRWRYGQSLRSCRYTSIRFAIDRLAGEVSVIVL